MKIVRSCILFVCGLVLFFSCMLLYVSGITQELFSSDMSTAIVENIDIREPIHKVLATMPNGILLQRYVDQQIEDVKKTLTDNEDFNQFVHTYSMNVMTSLADGSVSTPDIDNDIRNVISKHETELKNALGDQLQDSQKNTLINGMKDNIHLADVYSHLVQAAKERLTPQQLEMIKFMNVFINPFTRTLSYILMALSILVIIVVKRSLYAWLFTVGTALLFAGGILFIGSKIVGKLLSSGYSITANLISAQSQRMGTYAYWYLGFGLSACVLYMFGKFMFSRTHNHI